MITRGGARLLGGVAAIVLACQSGIERTKFVGTSETAAIFSLATDTLFEADSSLMAVRSAIETATSYLIELGIRSPAFCTRAFDAQTGWLVYAVENCHSFGTGSEGFDGDALVLVTRDGTSAVTALLNPGGITFDPELK